MNEFHFTSYAQEILFGPGSLAQLGQVVERMGWRRVLVSASGSARRGGTLALLGEILGERLVAVYEPVQAHVPGKQVDEALKLARESSGRKLVDPFSRTTTSPRAERTVAEMDRLMPSQQPPRESAEPSARTTKMRGIGHSSHLSRLAKQKNQFTGCRVPGCPPSCS